MPPTIKRLLDDNSLQLTLLTPVEQLPLGATEMPISWVHSSDLLDPTPFLSANQVLLVTGTQFMTEQPRFDDYVGRLREHQVVGIGFGTEVIREGTPEGLREACLSAGLPLFEVPYRTPFIAVARCAADIVAEETYARDRWALKAQKAISLAALRPDGLNATLQELSNQLHRWVGLFDASGRLERHFPLDGLPETALATIRAEAARMVRRGTRATSSIVADGQVMELQTLGRHKRLRGVLALGGATEIDLAGQHVVTNVLALAGLALEQNEQLERAHGHLRVGLWNMLLAGSYDLVAPSAREMWGDLPAEPVQIAVIDLPPDITDAVVEFLELRVAEKPGTIFFAAEARRMTICLSGDDDETVAQLARGFGTRAGVSASTTYDRLGRAHIQALQALEVARNSTSSTVSFDQIAHEGVLGLLGGSDAKEVGRAMLAPLKAHDEEKGTMLVASVRVWLELDGRFDQAAEAVGVHRHTMRGRIAEAERILGRSLDSFHSRANLWAAYLAVESE